MSGFYHHKEYKESTVAADSHTFSIAAGLNGATSMSTTVQYAWNFSLYGLGLTGTWGVAQLDQSITAINAISVMLSPSKQAGEHAMSLKGIALALTLPMGSDSSSAVSKTGLVGMESVRITTSASNQAVKAKIPGIEINA